MKDEDEDMEEKAGLKKEEEDDDDDEDGKIQRLRGKNFKFEMFSTSLRPFS